MTAAPNTNGVYEPDEHLSLHRDVKGWRGCPTAEITLADLGTHWIWATSFNLMTGDCWGSSSPLWNDERHSQPSRAAAIEAAASHLRHRLSRRAADCPDARRIMAWLDQLRPVQMELFAA